MTIYRKKWFQIVFVLSCLALLLVFLLPKRSGTVGGFRAGFPPGPPFGKPESTSLQKGDILVAIYGTGQLKTNRAFELKIGVQSRITDIKVKLGDKVKRNQLLVSFDNVPDFRSPLDGTVTALNYHLGESVFPQTTILSVVDSSDFFLEMSLDQKSVRQVKSGQEVRVSFDGYRERKFLGKVRSVYSNNSQFYAMIDLTNRDDSFLPGMTADIAIISERKSGVLIAPLGAVKNQKLLVIRPGGPAEIPVTLGSEDDSSVEIVTGDVREGDVVLVRPSLGKDLGGPPQ